VPILRVETTEGIVLELDVAGAGSRFSAALLDALVYGMPLLGTIVMFFLVSKVDISGAGGFFYGLLYGGFFFVLAGILALVHYRRGGSTPGKQVLGLVVVGEDGQPPGLLAHLLRAILWMVELIPVPVPLGILVIFFHPRRQRLGDMVAGTLVVRRPRDVASEHEPFATSTWSTLAERTLPLTPGLVARLGAEDLALLRRAILRRTLAPDQRERLLTDLARHYGERLGLEMSANPRIALRELYLCLREVRAGARPA
jgi:uncharacterized RDD family membrane protein YckC